MNRARRLRPSCPIPGLLRFAAPFAVAVLLSAAVPASAQSVVVFDVPSSALTFPYAISDAGSVVGLCSINSVSYGFVRASNGAITLLLPQGARGSLAEDINAAGSIVGRVGQGFPNTTVRGFVRDRNGTFTIFDGVPGTTTTVPRSINAAGTTTGWVTDVANNHRLGFVRDRDGTIVSFDVPFNSQSFSQTDPTDINAAGTIIGRFRDIATNAVRGFVRSSDGSFIVFDAVSNTTSTSPESVSDAGVITGSFRDLSSFPFEDHGFIRDPDGTITLFAAPNARSTYPWSINAAGTIVGQFVDESTGTARGFVRDPDGSFTPFDAIPGSPQTVAESVNAAGTITGWVRGLDGTYHGFVRKP